MPAIRRTRHVVAVFFLALLLGACGGGGGSKDALTAAGDAQTLTSVSAEAPGTNCPTGGSKVDEGPDTNRSGTLEPVEVTSTRYECNGPRGDGGDGGDGGAGDGDSRTFAWVTAGAEQQGRPNRGYVVTGDEQAVVHLPTEELFPDLSPGDVVQVKGTGKGGWKISQHDGQVVDVNSLADPGPSNTLWSSVACSSDGSSLAAATLHDGLYTSADGGRSWDDLSAAGLPVGWIDMAMSADGKLVIAAQAEPDGKIYVRTESQGAVEWHAGPEAFSGSWNSVASSADGKVLAAAAMTGRDKGLMVSHDAGQTGWWMILNGSIASAVVSPNGRFIVAIALADPDEEGFTEMQLLTFASREPFGDWDLPNTWTDSLRTKLPGQWNSVAFSADGTRVVATGVGQLATSNDSGITWTIVPTDPTTTWTAAAYSGDTLLAAAMDNQIYSSTDGGANWTPIGREGQWKSLCATADGRKVLAVESNTQNPTTIYALVKTTQGINGSISGDGSAEIELVYRGNGRFEVVNHEGELTVL